MFLFSHNKNTFTSIAMNLKKLTVNFSYTKPVPTTKTHSGLCILQIYNIMGIFTTLEQNSPQLKFSRHVNTF